MIKTKLASPGGEPPRRTYPLGSAACGGCGARSSCDCDTKVSRDQQSLLDPTGGGARPPLGNKNATRPQRWDTPDYGYGRYQQGMRTARKYGT